jgi:hypothetical protein
MPVDKDGLNSVQLGDGIPHHPVTCFASGHPERICLRLSDAMVGSIGLDIWLAIDRARHSSPAPPNQKPRRSGTFEKMAPLSRICSYL